MFIPILAYHKIHNNFDLGITRISPDQFENQIKYLFQSGFQTISLYEYIKNKTYDEKKIIITFDDGYESVFEHAFPVLSKYKFTATLFVITEFIGKLNKWDYNSGIIKSRHCNWEQIQRLISAGWEIGSHTTSHRSLTTLAKQKIWYELKNSKNLLENKIQKPVNVISYPFGKFDHRVIECAKKAGYLAGCTLGYNYPQSEIFPYALFRRGVYLFEPLKLFKVKLQNNRWSHCDDIKQKFITFCSQGSILFQHLRSNEKQLD